MNGEIGGVSTFLSLPKKGRLFNTVKSIRAMGEFFENVARYPKYLITIIIGVFASALQPLIRRSANPITAVSLIGALVSGGITLYFLLHAMAYPTAFS